MSKWEKVKLKDICNIVSGTTPKSNIPEYWNGSYNWVTPAEITECTVIINETQRKITDAAIKSTSLKAFPAGTVLLSSRAPIGKVAIAGTEMYCNQGFKNLICFEQIHNKYLFWFLKGKSDYLNALGRGATFKEISKTIVEKIEIPLPPLEVQHKIASILDTVSEVLKLRKQQLNELDLLVKSRFVEMFGDIKENPFNYTALTFKDISNVRQGLQIPISKRKIKPTKYTFPYITIQYLNGKKQAEYIENPPSNVICTKNDILMTRTGNTGMVITNVSGVFHNNFFLIDYNRRKLNKSYLIYYLNDFYIQKEIIRLAGTSTIPDLNHGDFYKIKIVIPPIDLQNKFAAFVQHVDELKSEVQKSINETQTLFDSLMQQYFE